MRVRPNEYYINSTLCVMHKVSPGILVEHENLLKNILVDDFKITFMEESGSLHSEVLNLSSDMVNKFVITYIQNNVITTVPQEALRENVKSQLGGTCGLAAPRLVNNLVGDFSGNIEKREVEICLTNYENEWGQITILEEFENKLLRWHYNILEPLLNQNKMEEASSELDSKPELKMPYIKMWTDYYNQLASSDLPLFYFVKNCQHQRCFSVIQKYAEQLQFDFKKEAQLLFEALYPQAVTSFNEKDSSFRIDWYETVLLLHSWKLRGFKPINWTVSKGLFELVKEVRRGICLSAIDIQLLELSPKFEKKFSNGNDLGYHIYNASLGGNGKKVVCDDIHVITIIGAEFGEEDNYIHYLDPNHASPANQPRIVVKMKYSDYISRVYDLQKNKLGTFDNRALLLYRALSQEGSTRENNFSMEMSSTSTSNLFPPPSLKVSLHNPDDLNNLSASKHLHD